MATALIEFCLRDHLYTSSKVTAIVKEAIYPVRIPRMDKDDSPDGPKLTYRRKSGGRDHYLDLATGHPMPTFELICWSRSYDEAKYLADAVREAMDGFDGTFNSIEVSCVINTNETDDFIAPEDASDEGWFFVVLDYAIRYSESVPTF